MTAQKAVAFLASKRRTVLLGGMAVILHGLSRNTKDYDIWLDPLPDVQSWAAPIQQLLTREPSLQTRRISAFGRWKPIIVGETRPAPRTTIAPCVQRSQALAAPSPLLAPGCPLSACWNFG